MERLGELNFEQFMKRKLLKAKKIINEWWFYRISLNKTQRMALLQLRRTSADGRCHGR